MNSGKGPGQGPIQSAASIVRRDPIVDQPTLPLPDADAMRAWLKLLYGSVPGLISVWSDADKAGRRFPTDGRGIEAAVAYAMGLDQRRPQGIYVQVTTLREHPPEGRRGGEDLAHGLTHLWADGDFGTIGHKPGPDDLPAPPNADAIIEIVAQSGLPEPSGWAHSGGGYNPVWILTTPHLIDGEEDRARIKQLTTGWQVILAAHAYRRGWSWDGEVGNLDRLMKLPGTINRKEGIERLASIGPGAGTRYDLDYLIAVADRLAPAARELLEQAAEEQQQRRAERQGTPAASTAASKFSQPFAGPADHDGPFDVLQDTASWADILQPAGWSYQGTHSDGREMWLRPAGAAGSASSEYSLLCNEHVAVNWSERSDLPVGRQAPGNKLTKGRLFAELHYGGDTSAAAADLLCAAAGTTIDGPGGRLPRHVLDEVARRCQPAGGARDLGTGCQATTVIVDPAHAATRPWPVLPEEAVYGFPGEIVRTIGPETEADLAALLFTLYAAAGAMIGPRPHIFAGDCEQGARIWPLIIGKTSSGVKGTSWWAIRRIFVAAARQRPLEAGAFVDQKIVNGLSSGEGLINLVRDGNGIADPNNSKFDEGVPDKRLLVVESEFASVLAQGKREGNVLLTTLRQAWDGGNLRTETVNPRRATGTHIAVVGHITPSELRVKLSEVERSSGTANRFLPVLSRRSKLLPSGGNLPEETVERLAETLVDRIVSASKVNRMYRTTAAEELWASEYARLARDVNDGQVAETIGRARPQVIRLSLITALLDGRREVDAEHLLAALAMWAYVEDSAWYVFANGSGNPDLDRLKEFVDAAGDEGVPRTAITNECFNKHRKKEQIDALVAELISLGDYEEYEIPTAGRPAKRVRRRKRK
ncbi:DUF3987 domain-containing protein [Streptomyces sp. 4N509B]|uniref:DUF3987 domain-containing protein n=1 Tax=Streptomyces sp. 4N509B TaxID=3457413 RepID=UPI003FD5D955